MGSGSAGTRTGAWSFCALDRRLEVAFLARERVEVAVRREVPEVARDRVMSVRCTFGGQLVREGRGLLNAVVVAERERQRELGGEVARGGVVVQPRGELCVAEGDAELPRAW